MGRRKLTSVSKKTKSSKKTSKPELINSVDNVSIKLNLSKDELSKLGFKQKNTENKKKVIPKFGSKDESSSSEDSSSSDEDSSSSDEESSSSEDDKFEKKNKFKVSCPDCKARDTKIKELQAQVDSLLSNVKKSNGVSDKTRFSVLSKVDFKDTKTGKKTWITQTKLRCRNDHHTFKTRPISIIEHITPKEIHGFWYFCSFNCTLSKIIELGGPRMWERISNLNKLYEMCFGEYVKIKPAGPIDEIDVYGGFKSIDKYRKDNEIIEKESRIIMPPIAPMIPIIETDHNDGSKINSANIALSQASSKVRLKRHKPLPKKSELIKSMGLKIKKK